MVTTESAEPGGERKVDGRPEGSRPACLPPRPAPTEGQRLRGAAGRREGGWGHRMGVSGGAQEREARRAGYPGLQPFCTGRKTTEVRLQLEGGSGTAWIQLQGELIALELQFMRIEMDLLQSMLIKINVFAMLPPPPPARLARNATGNSLRGAQGRLFRALRHSRFLACFLRAAAVESRPAGYERPLLEAFRARGGGGVLANSA